MKQERDDKIGRALAAAVQRRQSADACPDMDCFAAAIDNKLPAAELEEFRAHLAACPRCLEAYATAHELAHDAGQTGFHFGRGLKWAGSLIAVAAVAVLAIRLTQDSREIVPQIASAPQSETGQKTPSSPPDRKTSPLAEAPTEQPKQVLLAFADADEFWNKTSGQGDRPRYKIRGLTGEPPVMSSSSTAAKPSAAGNVKAAVLNAFRIGVSLRQVQLANDAADRVALADRLRALARSLETAGERDTARDTNILLEHMSSMPAEQVKASVGKLLAAKLAGSSYARLGIWAESVRKVLADTELHDMKRLSAEAGVLLKLDLNPAIKADLEQIRTALDPTGGVKTVDRDAVRKLLAKIVADF